jgi:TetR/AcrR family transcriptional regulator, transcriptional repressor for nem operon
LLLGPSGPSLPVVTSRRAQIVDAAAVLIGRQGYSATSIDEVIKESRLSGKSHFYHYFRSKEELGFEVLDRQFELFADRGLAILREPMIDPLERLHLFIDSLVAAHAARGCHGGSPFGTLATEMADAHEGFRLRIAQVFVRWSSQIQSLLWEARPQLIDAADAVSLSRFIIAALEGGLMMSRVKRDIGVMEGIAAELKRYIASYVRESRMALHPQGAG